MRQSVSKSYREYLCLKSARASSSERLAEQDLRFRQPFALVQQAIADKSFPGAALAVTWQGELRALRGFGQFTYDQGSAQVTAETIFDVASLTKAVATTTMAMLLYERGFLDLDSPVAAVLPELTVGSQDAARRQITFRMLLTHSSGFPAHARLYETAREAEVFPAACSLPLEAPPGKRSLYSDIGFILLGKALERLADDELARFCQREIFGPLGMTQTLFKPPAQLRISIPPTQNDRQFRSRIVQGEVDDENAAAMGGVAGHAGLFSNVGDLARFANHMLKGGTPILRPETVRLFTTRQDQPVGSSWALGWDTPSRPSQSGSYLSLTAYGHLGFTGTSLWIDPERQLAVAFLSNRTWPDRRSDKIKQVRPRLHDAIVEALGLVTKE